MVQNVLDSSHQDATVWFSEKETGFSGVKTQRNTPLHYNAMALCETLFDIMYKSINTT